MSGTEFRLIRLTFNWTQEEAAQRLGVTQAYLSMVERGSRVVSSKLAARAFAIYDVPATALTLHEFEGSSVTDSSLKGLLGALGYPGFAYLRGAERNNPAELLIEALDRDDLDARVTEALPWIPLTYPGLNWEWLIAHAKRKDRQNRLGFVVELARQAAEEVANVETVQELSRRLMTLERSRLANEDTLCKESMTRAERRWLRSHRSQAAEHWNLLTDLTLEQLDHVVARVSA